MDSTTRLVYQDQSGNLAVVVPAPDFLDSTNGTMDKLVNDSIPIGTQYHVVSSDLIPSDRYFRGAWTIDDGTKINVDLIKARKIHLDNLRIIRNEKLNALDIIFMQALEKKDGSELVISQKKQKLRDMPQSINLDAITDVETLKNFMPDILT